MHLQNCDVQFSPSDLINFLGCNHATVLDYQQLFEARRPHAFSDTDQLLAAKGREHETAYLKSLKTSGKTIAMIARSDEIDPIDHTIAAMRSGVDVIYQAALAMPGWNGRADFLIKVDQPSDLGPFSYEALDTKLARRTAPEHLIQLGVYSELLAGAQGRVPDEMHVVLGQKNRESFAVRDSAAYVRHARRRIALFLDPAPTESYPQPCTHCARCHWQERCSEQWENDDHLSLVANIQRSQREKLERAGIKTLAALAQIPAESRIPGLNADIFGRLRAQAALQFHKRTTTENKFELIACDEGRGFNRLPKPDPGDLFFDMEGDPLHPDGLEYLFGVCYVVQGEMVFKAFWAHDHDQEQKTFGEFMTFLHDHLTAHPNAFVYHYNHYEPTALKRLASRYAVAEHQLDDLLRHRKFVDLYKVVREAIRVSEPSYSLKNLETFYMSKRQGGVATAGDSIVVYNKWRVTQDGKLLNDIAAYNEVDCRSTAGLRNWLLELRPNDHKWFGDDPAPDDDDTNKNESRRERENQYADFQNRLRKKCGDNKTDHRWQLADLLGFYEREDKPEWWAFFDRQDRFPDELVDDAECLAGLALVGKPMPIKQSLLYTYTFPPQETKRRSGDQVVDIATGKNAGTIEELDEVKSLVKIKLGVKSGPLPDKLSVGPKGPINTTALRAALYRFTTDVLDGGNNYPAVRDILSKSTPRLRGRAPGQPLAQGDDLLTATTEAVADLDQSYLFIQGPPGSGKTYTSAHVIVELIKRGKRIGVAANSHKAIHNLLDQVEELATEKGVDFEGIKKSSGGGDSVYNGRFIRSVSSNKEVSLEVKLIAGSAWLFADERFNQHLDYLFIDEAGQVSVANVVAMGTSARNIVLVGDQMQLGQPIQGVHPGEAGLSILDFLLGEKATVAPDRGIFLDHTWRLRPEICRFISDAFYDGRLSPHPDNAKRKMIFSDQIDRIKSKGIHFLGVTHTGCTQKSEEEAQVIRSLYTKLMKQRFQDKDGKTRALTANDILVVSPYNVQVNHLLSVLPDGARVGTVDKFQGQEAPVVLVSMATSSSEYMPRDIAFLFSANRLNVAISRAQCLAIVVASPELLATPCGKIEDLRLVNKFCKLVEYTASP